MIIRNFSHNRTDVLLGVPATVSLYVAAGWLADWLTGWRTRSIKQMLYQAEEPKKTEIIEAIW